jgi:hypothetical protein
MSAEGRGDVPAPKGLSAAKAAIWRKLTSAYPTWSPAELFAFEMFLKQEDLADERQAAGDLQAAHQAHTIAFRYWRTLRFVDPGQPARKVGRPSGSNWNAARKAGAASVIATIGGRDAEP